MGGGFAPRFLVEAGFLVLLAVAAGFADLDVLWIVIVMAGGWALVTLIEILAWRAERRVPLEPRFLPRQAEDDEESAETARDSWDIEEILAPLPDEPEGEARVG